MQQTTHLGLDKPEIGVDRASINIINGNMDTLDSAIYDLQQSDSDKQDKLTPGANITINPTTNEISATDTTYLDMVGATSLADGAAGLAPKPNAGDEDKFLKGDGTWSTPSGGGGSSTLSGLDDVNITSPTEGQTLVYDSTSQEWINGASSGGAGESEEDVLFSASTATFDDITVDWDWDDYDLYVFRIHDTVISSQGGDTSVLAREQIKDFIDNSYDQYFYRAFGPSLSASCQYTFSANEITAVNNSHGAFIQEIVGIKCGGSGGSDVEANPQDTPTDTLQTIKIGDTVYNIPGSGSGGNTRSDVLWSGSETTNAWSSPIEIDDLELDNYDLLSVEINRGQQLLIKNQIPEGNDSGNECLAVGGYPTYQISDTTKTWPVFFNRTGNTLRIFTSTGQSLNITKVIGLKFGGLYTEKISDMTWTELVSTTTTSSATQIPNGTKYLALTAEMSGRSSIVAVESIEDIEKLMDVSQLSTWGTGYEWADINGNHTNIAMSVSNGEVTIKSGYNTVTATLYAVKATKPRIVQPEMQSISLGDGTTSRTFTLREAPNKVSMQGYTSGDGGWYESGWFIWGEPFMVLHGAQGSVATGGYVGQVSISYGQDGKSFTITATNAFGAFNRADNFSGTLLAE